MATIKLCECGCGQPTAVPARTNRARGAVAGQPMRFVRGHNRRLVEAARTYVVEDRGYDTPCWVWLGHTIYSGYGLAWVRGRGHVLAHRLFWQEVNGAVPEGLELDHLCRVRACVRPDHMEPVTHLENVRRGLLALGGRPGARRRVA